jgi:hypothetical protein
MYRNAFIASIFSHMNHLWSNYRNRMSIELVVAELQIKKNSNISSVYFYKFTFISRRFIENK